MRHTTIGRTAILTAAAALAVGGLAVAGVTSSASAGPVESYRVQSAVTTVGAGFGDEATVSGTCADGYHVRGELLAGAAGDAAQFVPTVDLDGDSNMDWHNAWGQDPDGSSPTTYRSLGVQLVNHSVTHSESTTVWWTCDPN